MQNIYEVDFYVVYHDTSKTVRERAAQLKEAVEKRGRRISCAEFDKVFHHRWCVNLGRPVHQTPKIEKNEVAILLTGESYSEDWEMYDRGSCSKIVDIYDCEKLPVKYTYSVRDGKKLAKEEVVEVTMEPEDFKAEMLKHRLGNI